MNAALMFSSESSEWETPPELFAKLDAEFHFELDVCASRVNAKCQAYFTKDDDGLARDWGRRVCWMNPPYGDPELACKAKCRKKKCVKRGHHISVYIPGIIDWMRKAYEASLRGATVVCLVPARTDTRWWHEYAMKGDDRRFLRGRLRFVGAKSSAPFPSAIIVFRGRA